MSASIDTLLWSLTLYPLPHGGFKAAHHRDAIFDDATEPSRSPLRLQPSWGLASRYVRMQSGESAW